MSSALTIPNSGTLFSNPQPIAAEPIAAVPIAAEHIDVEENSTLLKLLSYVPFIGIIPSFIQERSLADKIAYTTSTDRCVKLIDAKNQYKIANLFRGLLELTLLIASIASDVLGPLASGLVGVIGGPLFAAGFCTAVYTFAAGLCVYRIYQNDQTIRNLLSTRFGIRIHVF